MRTSFSARCCIMRTTVGRGSLTRHSARPSTSPPSPCAPSSTARPPWRRCSRGSRRPRPRSLNMTTLTTCLMPTSCLCWITSSQLSGTCSVRLQAGTLARLVGRAGAKVPCGWASGPSGGTRRICWGQLSRWGAPVERAAFRSSHLGAGMVVVSRKCRHRARPHCRRSAASAQQVHLVGRARCRSSPCSHPLPWVSSRSRSTSRSATAPLLA
mmetsp:Transcript_42638/g.123308  ORF Transcript_42638/g.123308 Transcript_42638/m.123308 type:complete len:212 (-) Transcript_42638:682-1317(-)